MRKGFDPGGTYACPYSAQSLGDNDANPGDVPAPMLKSKERPKYFSADQMDQGASVKEGR
jgi:hypothetical protein